MSENKQNKPKRLKDAPNYREMRQKRKNHMHEYKNNILSAKAKKALGFPQKIYKNWEFQWTTDNEDEGILDERFHPEED